MEMDVLMPVYNTPVEWVREAIDSIRNQSVKGFTLVIVDDNNQPGELRDLLYEEAACKCKTVVVRREENKGLAAALNSGLAACTGEVVIRMDSDDIAHRDLVKKHAEFFEQHPDKHICGVQIKLFSAGRKWKSHHPKVVTRQSAAAMNGFWFVNHPGVAYRRETVLSLGGYGDTPAAMAEDYPLWIKFLLAGYVIHNREEYLMKYRVYPKTSSAQVRTSREWIEWLSNHKKLLNG